MRQAGAFACRKCHDHAAGFLHCAHVFIVSRSPFRVNRSWEKCIGWRTKNAADSSRFRPPRSHGSRRDCGWKVASNMGFAFCRQSTDPHPGCRGIKLWIFGVFVPGRKPAVDARPHPQAAAQKGAGHGRARTSTDRHGRVSLVGGGLLRGTCGECRRSSAFTLPSVLLCLHANFPPPPVRSR